jgi:hypothetical protein
MLSFSEHTMLTLRAYMWAGDGPRHDGNWRAIAFDVFGLPLGRQAWIANMHHRWQILRADNGVYGEWSGEHMSKEEALAALEK